MAIMMKKKKVSLPGDKILQKAGMFEDSEVRGGSAITENKKRVLQAAAKIAKVDAKKQRKTRQERLAHQVGAISKIKKPAFKKKQQMKVSANADNDDDHDDDDKDKEEDSTITTGESATETSSLDIQLSKVYLFSLPKK
jgi:hypothetical protein